VYIAYHLPGSLPIRLFGGGVVRPIYESRSTDLKRRIISSSLAAAAVLALSLSMALFPTVASAHAVPNLASARATGIYHGGPRIKANATSESTNWSAYAVIGSNGAYHTVSGSWVQPSVTCTSRTSSKPIDYPQHQQVPGLTRRHPDRLGHLQRQRHLHPVHVLFTWLEFFDGPEWQFYQFIRGMDSRSSLLLRHYLPGASASQLWHGEFLQLHRQQRNHRQLWQLGLARDHHGHQQRHRKGTALGT
jgi:hypothetical protein